VRPAEQLKGVELPNGWTVIDVAQRKPNATGGNFSCGYITEHKDGQKGFLKALDYTKALQAPNTAELLLAMTNAYVFEKNLCEKCSQLSRIARAIDSGAIQAKPSDPYSKVEYLIFELAEHDIRAHLDAQTSLDAFFLMKTLHHVSVCSISAMHASAW
jgi:hypothetical protein